MDPKTEIFQSTLGIKYPRNREISNTSGESWLMDRREDDGAAGLWRIHDNLYDFSDFIDKHPGGKDWLTLTRGTDITEAFEVHHIFQLAENLLSKYYVRKAILLRNYPFTFNEDGFYKTLKRNVREHLKRNSEITPKTSNIYSDSILFCTFLTATLSVIYSSLLLGIIAGIFLAWTAIAGHNYIHRRDNFRMYYFDLCLLSSRDWRISHVLSHHLYTNSIQDLEISLLEPSLEYLPKPKSFWTRYGTWVYCFIIWGGLYPYSAYQRYTKYISRELSFKLTEFIPYSLPLVMYIIGNTSFFYVIFMWTFITTVGSVYFGFIGAVAAHHHPTIFHDGDTPRSKECLDWGLYQLDTVMDRFSVQGNSFIVLTNFGDHALHHLFPTLDHSMLNQLYPVFEETMKRFNVYLRKRSQYQMIIGHFMQLSRAMPNALPPYKRTILQEKKLCNYE